MVLRIILGIFPGCGASELQDAQGCPRMVLRIILVIVLGCGASNLQDARGWHEDAPGSS